MKTIHKFRIDLSREPTRLTLKQGFRVVRCEYLVPDKGVYLWVEQPLNITTPTVERQFALAFSGDPVPDSYGYLDTALDPFGPEAYHVFEVPVESEAPLLRGAAQSQVDSPLLGEARYQRATAN
ncbi:hypothetical protein SAMN04487962_10142 [Marinobacter segnicrescens]|uniref:DUF7352 domain-containing protein n=1 Tax=Marinobacter segnicrescens TaxID=430453 RepID=A0A1H9Y9Q5_9GAMM|nr:MULTISPECIES: hypothetical protein [Marinobacter]UZD64143.1 hypothetical protein LJ360_10820 [Marinobacter sp. AN1]SES65574.1 hypothetical protein SAMN04487962_10142 [Marinobacter segnicrescens]